MARAVEQVRGFNCAAESRSNPAVLVEEKKTKTEKDNSFVLQYQTGVILFRLK